MAIEIPTPQELAAAGQAIIRTQLDPTGSGAVDLAPGSRNDMAISVNTGMATRLLVAVADRATAGSIDTATGDDLVVRCADLYQDAPKNASSATTTVYLRRTGTAQTVIPNGSRFTVPSSGTQQGVAFAANSDVPVAVGVLVVAVSVTCTQTGDVGPLLQSAITSIQDALPDTTWAIYTPAPGDPVLAGGAIDVVAGGVNAETDDQARARVKQGSFDGSRQRGTTYAVTQAALKVPGVVYVVTVEPNDGTTLVFAGDQNYQLSAQLKAAIATKLEGFRCFGSPAIILPIVATVVQVTVNLYMQRPLVNYNVLALQQAATQQILQYFISRTRPDEYFIEKIQGAAESVHPETQSAACVTPAVSQRRPADTAYAGATSIPRYIVTTGSIQVFIQPPLTQ